MKLRMLLSSTDFDQGLVEVTPFRPSGPEPRKLKRVVDKATGRVTDVDPATGEVWHEYIRSALSISLTFVTSGEQGTSFDDALAWVEEQFKKSRAPLLDVTIEEVTS